MGGAAKFIPWAAAGLAVLALSIMVFATIAVASVVGLGGGGGSSSQPSSSGPGAGATVQGDVEFQFTYYDPAVGGINGTNCGGAHGTICAKSGSPTGYETTEELTGKKYTGAGAIPQEGAVDYSQVPLPYLHGPEDKWKNKGIVIPCYNDDKPFVPVDHYASSITEPNALDLAMTGAAHDKFMQCLQQRKVQTSPGTNGYGDATKIKGKIVELTK